LRLAYPCKAETNQERTDGAQNATRHERRLLCKWVGHVVANVKRKVIAIYSDGSPLTQVG
jgi:hypothetical protein